MPFIPSCSTKLVEEVHAPCDLLNDHARPRYLIIPNPYLPSYCIDPSLALLLTLLPSSLPHPLYVNKVIRATRHEPKTQENP